MSKYWIVEVCFGPFDTHAQAEHCAKEYPDRLNRRIIDCELEVGEQVAVRTVSRILVANGDTSHDQ